MYVLLLLNYEAKLTSSFFRNQAFNFNFFPPLDEVNHVQILSYKDSSLFRQ